MSAAAIPGLAQARRAGGVAAGVGGVACVAGVLIDRGAFFDAYLVAYVFWLGLALGALAFLMLHHLTAGRWGFVVQRPLEAAASTLPLFIPLFLGVLWGLDHLYPWAGPGAADDPLIAHKAPYLNVPFFVARAAVYLLAWSALAYLLVRWSRQQDADAHDAGGDDPGDGAATARLQRLAGPGLVAYVLTVSFAHLDWVMSLEPRWSSTIVGLYFAVSTGLTGLSAAIVLLLWLRRAPDLAAHATPERLHDLARLLIAFVMLWAYLAFSQYLIIWMGNLPEENFWYLQRIAAGWRGLTYFLVVFQFVLPFLLLKAQYTKRTAKLLGAIAGSLLLARWADLLWWIRPSERHADFALHWLDAAAWLLIGGLWLRWFCWQVAQAPLLARHDPRLAEAFDRVH